MLFRDWWVGLRKKAFRSCLAGVCIILGALLPVQIYAMESLDNAMQRRFMASDTQEMKSYLSSVATATKHSYFVGNEIGLSSKAIVGGEKDYLQDAETARRAGSNGLNIWKKDVVKNSSGQGGHMLVADAGMNWQAGELGVARNYLNHLNIGNTEFPATFSEQFGGGGGGLGVGLPGQGGAGPLGTQFIPMLRISERYDSNVFFVPKTPGLKLEDYVTMVSPQLFVRDSRSFAFTTLNVGTVGEYYAINSGLSYIGFNGAVASNLTPLVQRYFPGATLRISNAYTYTPNPPGFLNGNQNYSGTISNEIIDELPVSDQFVRSFQAFRVNTKANTFNVTGSFPISPVIGMQGSYSYATVDFGKNFAPSQQSSRITFNTFDTHTISVGPTARVSPRDTVVATYNYSQTKGQVVFESHAGTLGWVRSLAQNWVSRIYGGAALLQQEDSPSQTVFNGGASIFWVKGRSNSGLAYNAGIYPSYINNGGALLSNNVTLSTTYFILDDLWGSVGGSYARDVSIVSTPNQPELFFETIQGYARMSYLVSRTAAVNVGYTVSHSKGTFSTSSPGEKDEVFRQTVTLMLTTFWQL